MNQICLNCNSKMSGRSDKKFCGPDCKNEFNNLKTKNCLAKKRIKQVNQILIKNRSLLEVFFKQKSSKIKAICREKLAEKGFCFRFFTHIQRDQAGKTYFFCYEYGYRVTPKKEVILTKKYPDEQ